MRYDAKAERKSEITYEFIDLLESFAAELRAKAKNVTETEGTMRDVRNRADDFVGDVEALLDKFMEVDEPNYGEW